MLESSRKSVFTSQDMAKSVLIVFRSFGDEPSTSKKSEVIANDVQNFGH